MRTAPSVALRAAALTFAAASLAACGSGSSGSDSSGTSGTAAGSSAAPSSSSSATSSDSMSSSTSGASSSSTTSGSPTASGSTSAAPGGKQITMAMVAEHNSPESCWTVIDKNVYDVTPWISKHPGGKMPIKSLCGTDGTKKFTMKHGEDGPKGEPQQRLASFKIGTLAG